MIVKELIKKLTICNAYADVTVITPPKLPPAPWEYTMVVKDVESGTRAKLKISSIVSLKL